MKSSNWLALAVPALAIACGSHAVDLEGEHVPKITASSDPGTVATVDEAVVSLAVDSERLYWVGSFFNQDGRQIALRSCKKASCADSVVTYDPKHLALTPMSLALVGGEVIWLQVQGDHDPSAIMQACNIEGCDHGSRTISSAVMDTPVAIVAGAGAVFVSTTTYYESASPGSTISRIGVGPGDNSPTALATLPGIAYSLAVHGDDLYWLEQSQLDSITDGEHTGDSLKRTPADGSGSAQVVAADLALQGSNPHRLGFDDSHVYWSDGSLRGTIARCPLSGCIPPNAPEPVITPIRSPTTVWVDGADLYWAHDTAASGYGVSSCRIASCTATDVVAPGLGDREALTFDDTSIYAAATDRAVLGSSAYADIDLAVRRFPKVPQ